MNPSRLLRIACLSIAALSGLAGCAVVYRTPGAEATPAGELAVLEFSDDREMGTLVEVDGVPRPNWDVRRYELTPGKHAFKLNLNAGISLVSLEISFTAVAGHEYQIVQMVTTADRNSAIAKVLVRDKKTGEEVPRDIRLLGLSAATGS